MHERKSETIAGHATPTKGDHISGRLQGVFVVSAEVEKVAGVECGAEGVKRGQEAEIASKRRAKRGCPLQKQSKTSVYEKREKRESKRGG